MIAAVRVPPSACSTSQSMVIWRSPSALRSTTARSERPIRRWISCVRPPCLPLRRLAARALVRGARQHAVFGRHPALAAAAQPARHLLGEARGAEHMRVAEAHQAGALGMLGDAALERDAAQFVRRSFWRVA